MMDSDGNPDSLLHSQTSKGKYGLCLTLLKGLKMDIFFKFAVPILELILIYLKEIVMGIVKNLTTK